MKHMNKWVLALVLQWICFRFFHLKDSFMEWITSAKCRMVVLFFWAGILCLRLPAADKVFL